MIIDGAVVTADVETGEYVKRSVRLMLIARDLESGWFWTVDALANKYAVSRMTIYRDLNELQAEPLRVPLVSLNVWGRMGAACYGE